MKLSKHAWTIWGILLVVALVLMVLIPFSRTASWWIAAGCTVLMFLLAAWTFYAAFRKDGLESKILGWPVFKVGATALAVQAALPALRAAPKPAAVVLFFQNLIGLGLGPLFFGVLSDLLRPEFGEESVRYVLYGAAFLGLIPAFFFWRCSLRLNEELDQKG